MKNNSRKHFGRFLGQLVRCHTYRFRFIVWNQKEVIIRNFQLFQFFRAHFWQFYDLSILHFGSLLVFNAATAAHHRRRGLCSSPLHQIQQYRCGFIVAHAAGKW